MEDLVDTLTRGNPSAVKVVLASVVLALAVYQLALIAVGYGLVRPPFLRARPATRAHRAVGDTLAALIVIVALLCFGAYGWGEEDEGGGAHAVLGAVLLGVLAVKIAIVRRGGRLGRLLPLLGITVFALLALTWVASAGDYLGGD